MLILSNLQIFFKDKIKQFSQADLLKLLSYLEGELQARDVVIAALKVKIILDFSSFQFLNFYLYYIFIF